MTVSLNIAGGQSSAVWCSPFSLVKPVSLAGWVSKDRDHMSSMVCIPSALSGMEHMVNIIHAFTYSASVNAQMPSFVLRHKQRIKRYIGQDSYP